MEEVLAAARDLDEYTMRAATSNLDLAAITVPLQLVMALHRALLRLEEHGLGYPGTASYEDGPE